MGDIQRSHAANEYLCGSNAAAIDTVMGIIQNEYVGKASITHSALVGLMMERSKWTPRVYAYPSKQVPGSELWCHRYVLGALKAGNLALA